MTLSSPYAFESGVDGDLLHEVFLTFKGYLLNSLGQNERWTQKVPVSDLLPTKGNEAKVKLASLGYGVHEWVDERIKSKIRHYDYTVQVKRWANAIRLKLDDLEDENLNLAQYRTLISGMGQDFEEHKHQQFIDLLLNGFTAAIGTCFDGQFFFDSDHPLDDGSTQSNVADLAFADTALYTAIKQMEKMKKHNGLFANISPTHGIFPVALRSAVEAVLDKKTVANGSDNPLYKRITPIFDPRIDATSETAWFLLDANQALKPFFSVERKGITADMDMSTAFEDGHVSWGYNARYNASYGFYQVMWGTDGVP